MRPKINFAFLMRRWFFLVALLAVTMWFPSTREAQTICLRWLFHLKGNTFVQTRMPVNPQVHFTPKYVQELRSHSTNSLEDFALATATGDDLNLPPPRMEPAWTNNPLLPWMTWQRLQMAIGPNGTNEITPATAGELLALIHLAQLVEPTNGAWWQAEACVDRGSHSVEAAIQALRISAQIGNWNAGLSASFSLQTNLFMGAGLSELDAVMLANEPLPDAYTPQLQNRLFLRSLMIGAVQSGKSREFFKNVSTVGRASPTGLVG